MIFTLLLRAFQLCSNFKLFHQEILNFKNNFLKNGYPFNFIDVCIKRFLNNIFIDKKIYFLAPEKELVCELPFIGKTSLQIRSKLVKSVQNNLSFCHLNIVFQSPYKLRALFGFTDTLDKKIRDLVYRYSCSSWNATYYGKTYRHFFYKSCRTYVYFKFNGKHVKNAKEAAMRLHN